MQRVAEKVAFITGAARGQGRSHAVRLAEEGADIVAVDLCAQVRTVAYPMSTPADLDETCKLVEQAGGRILSRIADVRNKQALQAVADDALEQFGHIDIVLANAGIMPSVAPLAEDPQAWTDCIDVMLTGVYHTIDVCLPSMIERGAGGSIVITSSTAGLAGVANALEGKNTPGNIGYHAAKHGVVGLMRLYANMVAGHNIRVNTVHPTGVNSPMVVNDEFAGWVQRNPSMAASFARNTLPVELVQPLDISNAILFLCSDEGRYITGTALPVDAGFLNRS
jgi:SDR family mycofactocin-dependent oxidoreductase